MDAYANKRVGLRVKEEVLKYLLNRFRDEFLVDQRVRRNQLRLEAEYVELQKQ